MGSKQKNRQYFLQETKLVPGPVSSQATGKVFFSPSGKKDVVYKLLPQTFSFSEIKAFQACPLQYKYQYYLKLPTPGSAHFSFGQTMHIFELFLKDFQSRQNQNQGDLFNKNAKLDKIGGFKFLEQLYQKNWIDEWYKNKKQKEEYRKKGHELLKTFYEHLSLNAPSPKYLEKSFFLPLGDYKFTGKIDRADVTDGSLTIIDYKTSEKIPTKNDKDNLDQLRVYQWAAEEFLGERVTDLCYWYLSDNKFLREQTASKEEILELKSRLLESIERIVEAVKYDSFAELHQHSKDHNCDFEKLG